VSLIPTDLGLPAKFVEFRPSQLRSSLDIASDERRFSLLSAPTGVGKSLVYMAVSQMTSGRTLVLVGTKGLQKQLMADFAVTGMVDMRGQSNYHCRELRTSCELWDFSYCRLRHEEHGPVECPYILARQAACDADIVVTNYAYWMSINKYSDPTTLGVFDLIVLDEAHGAPDWLSGFCTIKIDEGKIRTLLRIKTPKVSDTPLRWSEWAAEVAIHASNRATELRAELKGDPNPSRAAREDVNYLSRLGRDLKELGASPDGQWVVEDTRRGANITPLWPQRFAERYLFRSIPNVVLCSATLSPSIAKYLGIGDNSHTYHEVRGGFKAARRPFTYVPTTRVDRRMVEGQVRMWINRIDAIVGERLDRKGIIHTRSYARAKQVMARSKHSDMMLTHDTRSTRAVVEAFKAADPPCVLVSPSIEEGFDFPYDECRYQILAKVPFVDGRSPLIKARSADDKGYVKHLAAQTIVQQYGRGMRSADDMCETFMIDDHWRWFQKAGVFPGWFKHAWRTVKGRAPEPLPLDS